jgi:hypothetical protein
VQTDIIDAELKTGKRGHKTELIGRSPSRSRKSALVIVPFKRKRIKIRNVQ